MFIKAVANDMKYLFHSAGQPLYNRYGNDGGEQSGRLDSNEVHTRQDHRQNFHGDILQPPPDILRDDPREGH